MSESLPERPDLNQLRRQAKELRKMVESDDAAAVERFVRHHGRFQGAVTLAAAQLVIARELGFASWPRLKAVIEGEVVGPEQRAEAFVAASIEGRLREAGAILELVPDVASHTLAAAAVLGDAHQVAQVLLVDREAAVAIDEVRGWPALLYACYSDWPQVDPGRAEGLTEVVGLLLDAGASPNTNDGGRYPRCALKGSVEANNPGSARLLLEAGANPDIGQPIGEAIGRGDHRCLELLLFHGARVAGTWAIGAAVFHDDPPAVTLLADALAADQAAQEATEALPDAAARASLEVVAALLTAGADPGATDEHGMAAQRLAVRAGRSETSDLLVSGGASDDSTDLDRFIGACRRADRPMAEALLIGRPDLRGELTDDDQAAIFEAANSISGDAVALMLDLGFSPDVQNDLGERPLHAAAFAGNAPAVRFLLDAGADVDARDDRFEATPLAFATVGSGEQLGKPGDWVAVVGLLVEAGASRRNVWISDKSPSEEVVDVLLSYGIRSDDEAEHHLEDDDTEDPPTALGDGVVDDVARHIEAAYRSVDLELLGSLLDPAVRWSGQCGTRAEVLEWYGRLMADGTRATVDRVEVDGNAVVLGLMVAGQADGARPAAAEAVVQVFTVENGQIVEIRGYPDRRSALARDHPEAQEGRSD